MQLTHRLVTMLAAGRGEEEFIIKDSCHRLAKHTPLPTPRGRIQTAAEMQQTPPADWASDLEACAKLLGCFGERQATGIQPAFGQLTDREWVILVWKHMDHHLRQVGV